MKLRRIFLATTAAALIGLAGCGQSTQAAWDTDNDGKMSRTEFYQSVYSKWDVNQNGYVTFEEFEDSFIETKSFAEWDEDNNSLLSFSEYSEALEDMKLQETELLDRYSEFDQDSNGLLGLREFTRGLYGTWDTNSDEGVTVAEFQTSLEKNDYFTALDSDQDGNIDEEMADVSIWEME